jgi:lipoprotein-releasing system permease protein
MGYPLQFALRYLSSKKRASISVGTFFAVFGVMLGVAALATIMSVTGGFHTQFRQKVLGVNAHVLVLKYSTNFREYRTIMEKVAKIDGIIGVAPFSINPMMLTHGDASATGVLVKGVDPNLSLGVRSGKDEWDGKFDHLQAVLDLPSYVIAGSLDGLRKPGATPAVGKYKAPPKDPFGPNLLDPPPGSVPPGTYDSDAGVLVDAKEELKRAADDAASAVATPPPAPPVAPPDPGEFSGGQRSDAGSGGGAASRGDAPPGELTPLPEDDVIPPDVDPDPCRDPKAVKELPGVVVGVALAKTLGLAHEDKADGTTEWTLGDCVMVTSPTIGFSFASGQIKPPVAKRFRVIAIFEAGFDQYDSKLIYTDLYEAQSFYDHGDTVTGVEMKVSDIDEAGEIADEIGVMLKSGLYHTMDWEELNHGLFTALTIQQWGMSAVLALIIVVAAFTVVATLIMVVLDKQKEISVLKAMGATNYAVLRIFVYQGGMIGVVGTTLGLLLGLVVCKGLLIYGFPLDPKVYFISQLPVQVRPFEFIVTGVVALFICLVATIIPSLYAAGLRPADGFRNN